MNEGTIIGAYRVKDKLGEGGMGAVYRADHTLLGRQAAIKVLLPSLSANEEVVTRFFNEARAVTSIADPGIVQVFDFGYHSDGSAYIVMELLQGEALDVRLRRLGRLAPADALRLMRQAASALAAAHGKGVIHRDLKPENIFVIGDPAVTGGERPKILDFGIAKLTNDAPGRGMTRTGTMIGTPVYMSPEQCSGAANLDHRADIYSLGCVLMCLLTGAPPFAGTGIGELIVAHLREPAPAPSSRVPGLPREVDELVGRCLAKRADDRYPSMTELARALGAAEGIVLGIPGYTGGATALPEAMRASMVFGAASPPTTLGGATGATSVSLPEPPPPRRARTAIIAAIGATVVGAAIAMMLTGGGDPPPAASHPAVQVSTKGGADAGAPIDAPAPIDAMPPALDAAPPATPIDAMPVTPPASPRLQSRPRPAPRPSPLPPGAPHDDPPVHEVNRGD